MVIEIFFAYHTINISGVVTFGLNFCENINKRYNQYCSKIITLDKSINKDLLKSYRLQTVVVDGINFLNIQNLMRIIKFLNSYKKAVLFTNYFFALHSILPFLHKGIKKIFVLHSDEEIYYNQARLFSSYFDKIVSVSSYIGEKLIRMDPYLENKHTVIPCGIPVDNNYFHSYSDKNISIVYSGRIVEEQKRVSRIVKIIKKLKHKTEFEFRFIGDGGQKEHIKSLLEKEINDGIVKFYDIMSPKDLKNILIKTDIFLLTSDYEGTPVALLEAMNCGCVPIVSKTKSGVVEVIRDNIDGFLIEPDNIEDYVDKILLLSKNKNILKEMSLSSFNRIKNKYSIDLTIDRYIEIFDSLFEKEYIHGDANLQKNKEFDLEKFYSVFRNIFFSEKYSIYLKSVKKIAIFGLGVSGKRTIEYIQENFPNKLTYIIDDYKKGKYKGIKIVDSKTFWEKFQKDVDCVVYGAYQKVNPFLIKNLCIPHIRLDNIV